MKSIIGTTMAVAAVAALAGCDSVQGIPSDSPVAASSTATALPGTPATTTPAPPVVSVGEVAGNPGAAAALRAWAQDLTALSPGALADKCWTISPKNTTSMYASKDTILSTIAQPGVDGQFAVLWKGPAATVSVKRSEIRSGYACPRVYQPNTVKVLNDDDAGHAVRRYLARLTGKPVNPADTEGNYPLLCTAQMQTWDPRGTGRYTAPPLANNPGKLTSTTAFSDTGIAVRPLRADYAAVEVPVTNSAGVTTKRTFTVTVGSEGYCIGDVSA